jgi:valyl-tRNA synthetase
MRILHPFMPFITEEIYRNMKERDVDDYIIGAPWPVQGDYNMILIEEAEETFSIISNIRNIRNTQGIPQKKGLNLMIKTTSRDRFADFKHSLKKMANLNEISFIENQLPGTLHFIVKNDEFFIPTDGEIDHTQQIIELERELEYTKGFLLSVMKKLNNKNFVNNAPEKVVAIEQKKKADAEEKILKLEESLTNIKNR